MLSLSALNANNASALRRRIEKKPQYTQTRIVEMNPVVIEDVPGGNQYNFVVAKEGVVRHSELPSHDALEGFDCRMGNEIVWLPSHHQVVVANQ